VRELENCIRRTATLSRHDAIQHDDFACAHGECLSATLWTGGKKSAEDQVTALARGAGVSPVVARVAPPVVPDALAPLPEASEMAEAANDRLCEHAGPDCPAFNGRLTEKDRLLDAMEKTGWVQAKAARLLGITPRQIGYALKKYHIEMKRF
jgi:Nif-specific regulatory protein